MGDPVECPGVYIDDRVRSERWVRRNSTDASMAPVASSFSEEPASLQNDVEALLIVCKQSEYSLAIWRRAFAHFP